MFYNILLVLANSPKPQLPPLFSRSVTVFSGLQVMEISEEISTIICFNGDDYESQLRQL